MLLEEHAGRVPPWNGTEAVDMKRIIDGKAYNTKTAEELASAGYGCASDFNHWRETLYRTKNGAYFLAGVGGPRSQWAERAPDGGYGGGRGISVLSEAEAREWVEKYNNAAYEDIFGAAPEA